MSDGSDGLAEHYHEKGGRHHTSKLRLYNSFGPCANALEHLSWEKRMVVYIKHIGWG